MLSEGPFTGGPALDTVADRIRVNAVLPGWTDTAMFQASLKRVPQLAQVVKDTVPLQRAASP